MEVTLGDSRRRTNSELFQPGARKWLLALVFLAALGVRFYRANESLDHFRPVRQYRSALIARSYYYTTLSSLPAWKLRNATATTKREGRLEPPLMELVAAAGYWIAGGVFLWIPRMISATLWVVGGWFLYLLATRLLDRDGALISTTFYLFLPYGVSSSMAFQPDPMMMMFMVAALYWIVRYFEDTRRSTLLTAAAFSAMAMFVKPVSLFFVLGPFLTMMISGARPRRILFSRDLWMYLALSLLPAACYYGYGLLVGGSLRSQASASFMPKLLVQQSFWLGWFQNAKTIIGYPYLAVAILGLTISVARPRRSLVMGCWMGYFVFGLVFTWHIYSHTYYSVSLIPIVALSIATVISFLLPALIKVCGQRARGAGSACLFLAILFLCIRHAVVHRLPTKAPPRIAAFEEIGDLLDHSDKTVFLSGKSGKALLYHAEIAGVKWPTAALLNLHRLQGRKIVSAADRLAKIVEENSSEFFIVTRQSGISRQRDLIEVLVSGYSVFAETKQYVIIDLRDTRK